MLPAFRSRLSAASFCALLAALLALPVITRWIGHIPREQVWAAMSTGAGTIGGHIREIYHDPSEPDVVLLGSSVVCKGVDRAVLEKDLSAHLGRPAHVVYLALNWQGSDLQYFLLRDYLQTHHPRLIVWNLPVPGSRAIIPHVEAFRFMRYGEYSDVLQGLSLRYRLTLYGDMILGAPRELLGHIRPNLVGHEELAQPFDPADSGYYGDAFVPRHVDVTDPAPLSETYETVPYPDVRVAGPKLNPYELHFALAIADLARRHGAHLVLLHIPIDGEHSDPTLPERADWPALLHLNVPMIGVSGGTLFHAMPPSDYTAYYYDQHLNSNGSKLFTENIAPALLRAYDTQVGR